MSLLSWCYAGADAARAAAGDGTQRARSGDAVFDDELGEGFIVKLIGSDVMIHHGETERDKARPCKLVYDLAHLCVNRSTRSGVNTVLSAG